MSENNEGNPVVTSEPAIGFLSTANKYQCRKCGFVSKMIGWCIWSDELNLRADFCTKCTTEFMIRFFIDNGVGLVDEVKENEADQATD